MDGIAQPADQPCGCILLAAGASSRLGTPKQLLLLNGQSLIRRASCLAVQAGYSPVTVVLGSNAERLAPEIAGLSVHTVYNADWQSGMSSSLHAGLASMISVEPDIGHALVMVCDQVQVDVETLRRLLDHSRANPRKMVAATYSGIVGVPAIFPRRFFPNLLATKGDKGARALLHELRSEVEEVAFPGGSQDIDTLEDAGAAGLL